MKKKKIVSIVSHEASELRHIKCSIDYRAETVPREANTPYSFVKIEVTTMELECIPRSGKLSSLQCVPVCVCVSVKSRNCTSVVFWQ